MEHRLLARTVPGSICSPHGNPALVEVINMGQTVNHALV
jgi:hypothetical protein